MTPALTPELALAYVRELSADVRAGVVLDADGAPLAGPEELAGPARELLDAAQGAQELDVIAGEGCVFAVRSDRHALVVACGRHALPAVVRYDLRTVLAELDDDTRKAA